MQKMLKSLSKTKANAGINLGGNTIAIQWQYRNPNNGSSQYSMTVQQQVAISHLDLYQWTLGSSKEGATIVENLDIESGIAESS